MANNSSSGGGMSLLGVLGVVFIVLKLTHVINWSWWLVLLPFYGGLVLIAVIGLPILVVYLIKKRRNK